MPEVQQCVVGPAEVSKAAIELWAWISGYEGFYEVSSFGLLRTWRVKGNKQGVLRKEAAQMSPGKNSNGYRTVRLAKNKKATTLKIHSLVAETFIGPRPDGTEINHKDGCKTNNRVENLEYVTRSENQKHAYRLGLKTVAVYEPDRGEDGSNAILTTDQVIEMRRLRKEGMLFRQLAKRFGVSFVCAWDAVKGKTWKHLPI